MTRIVWAFPLILLGCSPFQIPGARSDRVILWEEPPDGFVARCLVLRGIPFRSDARGLVVTRDDAAYDGLAEVLGLLRARQDVLAHNLANAETTGGLRLVELGPGGERYPRWAPYFRRDLAAGLDSEGRLIPKVFDNPTECRKEYDPQHPHSVKTPSAEDWGWVYLPNVYPATEMIDLIEVARSYRTLLEALRGWE